MRRQVKDMVHSVIISEGYAYPANRQGITAALLEEQDGFCAYTDERISAALSVDIEHYNPTLKETTEDTYANWYLVSTKWNKMKGTRNAEARWQEHQPVYSPVDEEVETDICYDMETGCYRGLSDKGRNTVNYLHLDHPKLSEERRRYIETLKDIRHDTDELVAFLRNHKYEIRFPRAIQYVFDFNPIEECLK